MNIELHTFRRLPTELQQQFALEISSETFSQFAAEQKIIPVEPESILQRELGLVALQNDLFAGYVGATKLNDQYAQIGTLVVLEQHQGLGIGAQLISDITKQVIELDLQPYTFCNPSSQLSFKKAGYTPALPSELPPGANSQFNNQPMIYPDYSMMSAIKEPTLRGYALVK